MIERRTDPATAAPLFAGPGEMRARCRAFDWSATPLGPVETWPVSLRTTVATMLAARHPMILFWGPERIQLYNDAYIPTLGGADRHPAALGMRAEECWAGDVWQIVGPQIDQVMASGQATWHDDQYVPLPRHGRVEDTYYTYSYGPAYDDAGRVAGVLAITQETTARVLAQRGQQALMRALTRERARLADLFEQAPTFLAVLRGPEHVFTRVNETYLQLVGHRDILEKPVREALPEAVSQGFIEILDTVLATGEPFVGRELSIHIQRTPGAPPEERFLDFVYQPLVEADDEGSRVTGVVAHGFDVSEQVFARRAVERAAHRAAHLQRLTASLAGTTAPDDVAEVVVRQGAETTGAATGLLALLGPSARDARGELHTVRQAGLDGTFVDGDASFPLTAPGPAAECVRTGEAVFCATRDEVLARYGDIADVWTRLRTHALATVPLVVAGEVVGAMSFTFSEPHPFPPGEREFFLSLGRQCAQSLDRARLFAAEREAHRLAAQALAEAEAARERAEEANRAKADFLGVISHELRTPLNAIGGYAQLMEIGIHGPVTPDQQQALDRIQTSQRHLLGLINSVLNYTRVEAGAVHYDIADVPLDEVLATCEALVAPQVRARKLELRYDACDATLCARADREKVQQIVLNLLSNAVKFTAPGGRVEMDCEAHDDMVAVRVTDTGRGIPPEQLDRVFHPFVQVDAKLTRTHEGVGLGLAISRDLAHAMGGDLVATSTMGVGSTFTLTLPRAG